MDEICWTKIIALDTLLRKKRVLSTKVLAPQHLNHDIIAWFSKKTRADTRLPYVLKGRWIEIEVGIIYPSKPSKVGEIIIKNKNKNRVHALYIGAMSAIYASQSSSFFFDMLNLTPIEAEKWIYPL